MIFMPNDMAYGLHLMTSNPVKLKITHKVSSIPTGGDLSSRGSIVHTE